MDVLDWCPPHKKTPLWQTPKIEPVLEQLMDGHLTHNTKLKKKNYWAGHELLGHTY